MRRWPLILVGISAGVATWSGWVGLGKLSAFGPIHPLPGIWDSLVIDTAITLPIGIEVYGVYALGVATATRPMTRTCRMYAWTSAVAALALGMVGQAVYHTLAAQGATHAPLRVAQAVSCLPVLLVGLVSVLWHLDHRQSVTPASAESDGPPDGPAPDRRSDDHVPNGPRTELGPADGPSRTEVDGPRTELGPADGPPDRVQTVPGPADGPRTGVAYSGSGGDPPRTVEDVVRGFQRAGISPTRALVRAKMEAHGVKGDNKKIGDAIKGARTDDMG